MGYAGYNQLLCANGHLLFQDVWETGDCHFCNAQIVFCNSVDDTNGEQAGKITEAGWKTLLISETVYKTCPLCEHSDIIEPSKYRIPTREELDKLRTITFSDGACVNLKEWHDNMEEV